MRGERNKIHLCVSRWRDGIMLCGLEAKHGTCATKNGKHFDMLKDERACLRCRAKRPPST